ncbi:MAG TPA: hypothetical protein VEI06_06855 [Gemmatimonadaceae bacterium]|nr:hypothetical protein [Gemmatimonadaceae bacterium]
MSLRALSCLLLAILLPCRALRAQEVPGPSPSDTSGSAGGRDTTAAAVHHVQIIRQSVFDSSELHLWYARLTNSLHFRTKAYVVRREILIDSGTRYDSTRATETARNLRKIGVFRYVNVDSVATDSGLLMRVITKDAWSTKPYFSFRLTGGQVAFAAGVAETNVLGTTNSIDFRYSQNPDRNALRLGITLPRLIENKIGLSGFGQKFSDGTEWQGMIAYPFYSIDQIQSYFASARGFDGTILQFVGGDTTAADSLHREYGLFLLGGTYALRASKEGYFRVGMQAQVRRDDFVPIPFAGPVPQTITGATDMFVESSQAKFLVVHNYENMGPQEDFDVSTTWHVGLTLAPSLFGYPATGAGLETYFYYGAGHEHGFYSLEGTANGLWSSQGLDSGYVRLIGSAAVQPTDRAMAVFHLEGGLEDNQYPGEEFDLGLLFGPRAFPLHAFTGNRYFYGMTEVRHTTFTDVFKILNIGFAAFADYGGAWYSGSPVRTGIDAGAGIRLGATRLASTNGATRIDLAYRFANDALPGKWVVVVGTGFPFISIR